MKIQYASDLHLELSGNSKYVKEIPFEVTGDILVLAGDTAYLRDKNLPDSKFWKWDSVNYREVFLVPGIMNTTASATCLRMVTAGAVRFSRMSTITRIKWSVSMILTSSFRLYGHRLTQPMSLPSGRA